MFGKKVILWHTSLSEQWNLGMPPTRRHPHHAQGRERCQNILHLQMISMLQSMQGDDSLWRGSITIIATRFDVACSTVYQLWEQMACTHATGDIISPEIKSWKQILGGLLYI